MPLATATGQPPPPDFTGDPVVVLGDVRTYRLTCATFIATGVCRTSRHWLGTGRPLSNRWRDRTYASINGGRVNRLKRPLRSNAHDDPVRGLSSSILSLGLHQ